ncbi:MAG: translation initiation factor IF-3 [Candidatus Tectimicrobiota bacterium]|nr:MAG: translation initiation factor IF-3 [Candidatus Tectomicrobia bacterium]
MIRAREVRVVSQDGVQLGIMPLRDALQLAEEQGLDLVEVAPHEHPPVCRIMDYGKFKYQQSKRLQQAKKKQKVITIKEIKLRPKTEEHDYQFKSQHVRRFLQEGHKAKVTVMFRGRELAHVELGERMLARLAADVADVGVVEQPPRQEGRTMTMVLGPRHP